VYWSKRFILGTPVVENSGTLAGNRTQMPALC